MGSLRGKSSEDFLFHENSENSGFSWKRPPHDVIELRWKGVEQCGEDYCSVWQRVSVCCSVLHCAKNYMAMARVFLVLQDVAVCCSVLQIFAV